MNVEKDIIKLFSDFIKDKSIYGNIVLITRKTPLNIVKFPTIVIKESNNADYVRGMTTNMTEAVARLTYQVDIYTKDIILEVEQENENGTFLTKEKKYSSDIQDELKNLMFFFFTQNKFTRISSGKSEYLDYEVDRTTSIFEGKLGNWNRKIL